tara:strand:- start:597 stop:1067 length:471 start_codon:yes stop_codon:yes gene_type:complete
MKITKKQIIELINEVAELRNNKSMLLEAPREPERKRKEKTESEDNNEWFMPTIEQWSANYSVKMKSIVTAIYKMPEVQAVSGEDEKTLLDEAADELFKLRAENPVANMILEELKFLHGPAVLLKEVGGAAMATSMQEAQLAEIAAKTDGVSYLEEQ